MLSASSVSTIFLGVTYERGGCLKSVLSCRFRQHSCKALLTEHGRDMLHSLKDPMRAVHVKTSW